MLSLRDFYYRENGYEDSLIPITILDSLLPKDKQIYFEKTTGVVCSKRTLSEREVLEIWSDDIYKDKSLSTGYSSNHPYSEARLKYVVDTSCNYFKSDEESIIICDFSAGTGGTLDSLKKRFKYGKIYATEGSKENAEILQEKGYNHVVTTMLGKELNNEPFFKNEKVDIGYLCWTLCNCINPLDILLDIRDNIKSDGYICIAEGSRILVPGFRKSIVDYIGPKTHDPDVHPFHWSFKSIKNLLTLAGFELVYTNKFIDNDVMMAIGQKRDNLTKQELESDKPDEILNYFKSWVELEEKIFNRHKHEDIMKMYGHQ